MNEKDDETVQEERDTVWRRSCEKVMEGNQEQNRPEHNQNVGYVVHPIIVDELQLFVGSRHKKQPIRTINLGRWVMQVDLTQKLQAAARNMSASQRFICGGNIRKAEDGGRLWQQGSHFPMPSYRECD
jgi:hypothetical protein